MANVVIELNQDQEKRLRALAAIERRTAEELCSEAVETYLRGREPGERGPDRYHALQKMIGLAPTGPTDASVRHDVREEDALKVFIDSGGWLSVLIATDQHHEAGKGYFQTLMALGARIVTTDFVLDEVVTLR